MIFCLNRFCLLKMPKMIPKGPQQGPKRLHETPKEGRGGPKMRPRRPQDGPKTTPGRPQDGSRTAQVAPKPIANRIFLATPLQAPLERSPRGPQDPPGPPPGLPREAQEGSKRANLGSSWVSLGIPRSPKMQYVTPRGGLSSKLYIYIYIYVCMTHDRTLTL